MLSNSHLMESELLCNSEMKSRVSGTVVGQEEQAEGISTPPVIVETRPTETTTSTAPTVAPRPVEESTVEPVPVTKPTNLEPVTETRPVIVNVGSTEPIRGVPVMIDPIVGIGSATPVFMGGGGGGGSSSRSAEEEEVVEEKKSNLWIWIVAGTLLVGGYYVFKK